MPGVTELWKKVASIPGNPLISPVDFVIITALPPQRDAILNKLPGYQQLPPDPDNLHIYYRASLPVSVPDQFTGRYEIVVMCLRMKGQQEAVEAAKDAIQKWRPRCIFLVGMAGGIAKNGVQPGDVLIADQIIYYELPKIDAKGLQMRWEVHLVDPALLHASQHFGDKSWMSSVQARRPAPGLPNLHTGPVATGDPLGPMEELHGTILAGWPNLVGIEGESSGVVIAAGQTTENPGIFMVRGVSALTGEEQDPLEAHQWEEYAAEAAASFTISFLQSGPVRLSVTVHRAKENKGLPFEMKALPKKRSVSRRVWRWIIGVGLALIFGFIGSLSDLATFIDTLNKYFQLFPSPTPVATLTILPTATETSTPSPAGTSTVPSDPRTLTPAGTLTLTPAPAGKLYSLRFITDPIPKDGKVHYVYISKDEGAPERLRIAKDRVDYRFSATFSKSIRVWVDIGPGVMLKETLIINDIKEITILADGNGVIYEVPQ